MEVYMRFYKNKLNELEASAYEEYWAYDNVEHGIGQDHSTLLVYHA